MKIGNRVRERRNELNLSLRELGVCGGNCEFSQSG